MKRALVFFLALAALPVSLAPEEGRGGPSAYPPISRLDLGDTAFRQYLEDVETARRRLFNRRSPEESSPQEIAGALTVYSYSPLPGEDLLSLAARCNIPYAAIATLNRLSHPEDLRGSLLLPSAPGLFIPEKAESDLELLMEASRPPGASVALVIRRGGAGETFRFIPGADFSATERVFFLNRDFHFPLRSGRLTSSFGPRVNPVTGVFRTHQGIDLAAAEGTAVFAARAGEVAEAGEDPVYGRYVVIRHRDGWMSLYGHLSTIETALRSAVQSGSLIGRVGSTGQSTGPHLHFELRQNGQARDPEQFFPGSFLRIFRN